MTKFSEVLHNEHFNRLAIIINIPFHSPGWKNDHPHVPFWTLWTKFDQVTPISGGWNRSEVVVAFKDLITSLVFPRKTTEPGFLFYNEDDLDWFFEMLDSPNGEVMISMFKAWVSAAHSFITPQEVAEATGTSESNWRNRAACRSGYQPLPGCRKIGKNWLIPLALLQAQGILPWNYKKPIQTDLR